MGNRVWALLWCIAGIACGIGAWFLWNYNVVFSLCAIAVAFALLLIGASCLLAEPKHKRPATRTAEDGASPGRVRHRREPH